MSDELEPEIYVKLSLDFKAIRVIGTQLIPTTWQIVADVIYDDAELEDQSPDQDIQVRGALNKIRYWVAHVLNGSILISRSNEWAISAFVSKEGAQIVDNSLVLLPDEPTDEVIAQVLQSKMNALGNCFVTFGAIDIESDDAQGLSFIFTGISELNLPSMDEWIGERTYFNKPWWARNDASTIDVTPNEDTDLSDLPGFAISLDFLIDHSKIPEPPKGQIIHKEFRPTVIDGGK